VLQASVDRAARLLLISGSLRSRSINTAALRTGQVVAAATGIVSTFYEGLKTLPHFNPDDDGDPLHPAVAALRSHIRHADAICFSTPEYAGALPGSFKNLLDWTIGDEATGSIYEKPVAWINTSARGAARAHESLRTVLRYAHAEFVERACVHISVTAPMLGSDGVIADPTVRHQIGVALSMLAAHAHRDVRGQFEATSAPDATG
jgi:chromate reductase